MKKGRLTIAAAVIFFAALAAAPSVAAEGARGGLRVCGAVIVPALLPFLIATSLLSEAGVPAYLARAASPFMSGLFGVGGVGAAALMAGLLGGYPMGAASIADIYRRGLVSRDEAERLLSFCNNTGPAFIIGAVGGGVFRSAAAGWLLYAAHILSALLCGLLLSRGGARTESAVSPPPEARALAAALTSSVKSACAAIVGICGFVVLFSVVAAVLEAAGVMAALTGRLAAAANIGPRAASALLRGFLELGSGVAYMEGLPATPANLSLAALLLGWGGLSVQCQTLAVLSGTDIKTARHFAGRCVSAAVSAALMYFFARLL